MGFGRIAVVPRQIVESVTRRTVKVLGASRLQKIRSRKKRDKSTHHWGCEAFRLAGENVD